VKHCRKYLMDDIKRVKPKIIIPLGAAALYAITGQKSIKDNRGIIFSQNGYYVVPTYHPAVCLHGGWEKSKLIVLDMILAKRLLNGRPNRNVKYKYVGDLDSIKALISYLEGFNLISVDVETTSVEREADVISIQLSVKEKEAFFIPLLSYGGAKKWEENEKLQVIDYLRSLLERENIAKVFANAKFDLHFLRKLGIEVKGKIWDVILMHHLIDENLPHSLKVLGRLYTNVDFKEDEVKKIASEKGSYAYVPTPLLVHYACADVDATIDLFKNTLYPELKKQDLLKVYNRLIEPTILLVLDMEERGVLIDKELLGKIKSQVEMKLKELLEKIKMQVGKSDFNPNSSRQLSKYLFEILKLTPYKKTPSGAWSVDDETLNHLDHPFVELLKEYRKLSKLYSTFLRDGISKYIKEDGRIHANYIIHGTNSGRFSASHPNVQQVPAEVRECFTVPKGWKFVSADMSQSELRIAAYLSGDENLIEALNSDDFHTETCWRMGICKRGKKPTKQQRTRAKALMFGAFLYGGHPRNIAKRIGISEKLAEKYVDALHESYPVLHSYLEEQKRKVLSGSCVLTNIFGRKRHFYDLDWVGKAEFSSAQRKASNFPIQSASNDILFLAQIRIWRRLKEGGFRAGQIISLHDEGMWEVPDEEVDEVARIIKEEFERPIPELDGYRPKVEVKIRDRWGGEVIKIV
ncbi:hypothetical protein J7M02_04220, partial [Candidatus Aerophobetes bacterium]|nr:hypothetical protein [Candidatus Aerophobetes bacterium]